MNTCGASLYLLHSLIPILPRLTESRKPQAIGWKLGAEGREPSGAVSDVRARRGNRSWKIGDREARTRSAFCVRALLSTVTGGLAPFRS